jgi:hypothetical protein
MLFYQKLPTMSSYYTLGGNGNFQYFLQHCFICRPSDSIVSEDAGIEPRKVATSALVVLSELKVTFLPSRRVLQNS